MGVLSVWPFLVSIAALLGIACLPVLAPADVPPSPHADRFSTLDGLRGFLALGVLYCHGMQNHDQYLLGTPDAPPVGNFYELLGHVSVQMFFMITGFLFWSRLIERQGRLGWVGFFVGRVFRIGPVYLLAVAVSTWIVLSRTGFRLEVPGSEIVREAGRWLALGVRSVSNETINGYAATPSILMGVTWTLQFEWLFYFSLPLLALATRQRRFALVFAVLGIAICVAWSLWRGDPRGADRTICALLFLCGMASGALSRTGLRLALPSWVVSMAIVLLVSGVFALFDNAYHVVPIAIVAIAFYLIASGNTLFGLLTSRPARRLGNVSYGIYLLHGIIFALAFSLTPVREFASESTLTYWLTILATATAVVAVATAVHVAVERPGIELGGRVRRALRAQPD